jgi:predicted metal-binding membrane protein
VSAGASAAPRIPFSWLPWVALPAIAAICWVFLLLSERSMGGDAAANPGWIAGLMRLAMHPEDLVPYLATTVLMWGVMMVAMMVPAVLPMARAVERAAQGGARGLPGAFAAGYLLAWSAFAVLAAGLQWALHQSGWLQGRGLAVSPALGGGILVAAGLYQLTPFKNACLSHCRSPIRFVLEHWRPGRLGSLRMGLHHGLYCVGCCWLLMLLMFVGGAMSVVWMAALSILILAERILPEGPWVSRLPGALLAGAGVALWLGR